jgi:hypothetical protein
MTPRRLNPQGINNVFLETVLQYLARTFLCQTPCPHTSLSNVALRPFCIASVIRPTQCFNTTSRMIRCLCGSGKIFTSYKSSTSLHRPLGRPIAANGVGLERVTPSDLCDHRISHYFSGPCCLCPYVKGEYSFREAAICTPDSGRYKGEYVAGCALRECGYFGKFANIYQRGRRTLSSDRSPFGTHLLREGGPGQEVSFSE